MPLNMQSADVLASDATSGEVRCTLGDATTGLGFAKEAAIYGPGPLVYRPNPPDSEGNAAQALYIQDSDTAQVVGIRDNRWAEQAGTLDEGDWAMVTNGEARMFCKKERNAIALYTLNEPDNKSMVIDLGGSEGELRIINGDAVITMTHGVINLGVNGGGTIKIDSKGVTISGSAIQLVGAVVQLGDVGAGTPPPSVPPLLGVAYGVPGPITTVSTKVFVAA